MSDRIFVDTNILVYAHDEDAGEKHAAAAKAIADLWECRNGVISTQVLQEFYVTLTRKVASPVTRNTACRLIRNYLTWELAVNDGPILLHASEIEGNYRLSFWDGLIVAAAYSKNAAVILTEDLNHGQTIEGILIQNPFLHESAKPYK
jgi:predicted nucleic acid-binding protein